MTVSETHDPARHSQAISPAPNDLLRRIESEYREMPGMCVTAMQAQRLWGLDSTTCLWVLSTLVERRILRRTIRGTYIKS